MPDSYNPSDWYWIVGGDQTKVFSSKVGDYLAADDASYAAWLARDNAPTKIASEAELGEVLAPLSLRPTHAGVLDAYKEKQAVELTIAVVAKVLFNHENRMRALEGKNQIAPAQFKNALKALM